MLKRLLSSAAAIGLLAGVAAAQGVPSPAGLTPGAPLGTDPYTGEGVVVGEEAVAERRAARMPAQEPVIIDAPAGAAGAYGTSSFGLTPGAPLGSDPISGQKRVVGERR